MFSRLCLRSAASTLLSCYFFIFVDCNTLLTWVGFFLVECADNCFNLAFIQFEFPCVESICKLFQHRCDILNQFFFLKKSKAERGKDNTLGPSRDPCGTSVSIFKESEKMLLTISCIERIDKI